MAPKKDSMDDLLAGIRDVKANLMEQDRRDAARRLVDDERNKLNLECQKIILERLDRHGNRTTAIETKITGWFEKGGVISMLITTVAGQGKLIQRALIAIGVGTGIILTVEFFLKK